MVIGIKDSLKLIGISIVACCAIFVCTLFLNYQMDIVSIQNEIITQAGIAMYEAQVSMGKVVCTITGGCLALTSAILLVFYIKNYIDTHGKELGILKALGYSNGSIARHFWVFGISILIGCALGYGAAAIYMPTFYEVQNTEQLLPEIAVQLHLDLAFLLVGAPTLAFMMLSIGYAWRKLQSPVLDLLRERTKTKIQEPKKESNDEPFLKSLRSHTLKSRKILVFFIMFSGFCFSAMTQMSISMQDLASETFAWMIISIGLILAFMALLLSLTSVMKANTKTIAMMRVFGYQYRDCSAAILSGYRPFSYIGFIIGTVYQYVLLKIMVTVVFADVAYTPEYHFNQSAFILSLIAFILTYEGMMHICAWKIKKLPIKSIMQE